MRGLIGGRLRQWLAERGPHESQAPSGRNAPAPNCAGDSGQPAAAPDKIEAVTSDGDNQIRAVEERAAGRSQAPDGEQTN